MSTIACGHSHVCAHTCLGTIMYVHKRVLAQTSAETCVWEQACYWHNREVSAYKLLTTCLSIVHVSACSFAVSQASDLALLVGYVA